MQNDIKKCIIDVIINYLIMKSLYLEHDYNQFIIKNNK